MLVVDPHDADRESISGYFRRQGFSVNDLADAQEAKRLLGERFFPVVLVDIDVQPWGGVEFVAMARAQSPRTDVVLLTTRRAYDVAVNGFRRGAVDVVFKDAADAPRLLEAVERAVRRAGTGEEGEVGVQAEARGLLDEMLRELVEMSRRVPDTQSRLATMQAVRPRVAVVDHEGGVFGALSVRCGRGSEALAEPVHVPSGGNALDVLSGAVPEVLLVREDLIDFPASTLVATLSAAGSKTVALVYRLPGPDGEAAVFEGGHPVRTIRPIASIEMLMSEAMSLIQQAAVALSERRVMDLFRMEHAELLRRYAALRGRLEDGGGRQG